MSICVKMLKIGTDNRSIIGQSLVKIKSIRDDFEGSFKFGLVGSAITWERLIFEHTSLSNED